MDGLKPVSQFIQIIKKTRRNRKNRRKRRAKKWLGFFNTLSPTIKRELFERVSKFKDDMYDELPIAYYNNFYDYLDEIFRGGILQRRYTCFEEFETHFTDRVGIEKNRQLTPKKSIYMFLQYLVEICDTPQKLSYIYELLIDIGYMYCIEPIPIDKIDSYSV
jgi:hypothetical protein